jgi:predicted HAD superfamily Cof-like phosphohydrolase
LFDGDEAMSFYTDVRDFHQAFGQRIGEKPELPDIEERKLRIKLLDEEVFEYTDAEYADDLVEIADALADIIYIACGTAVSYGIPLDDVFDEVHRSNMAKLVDGKVIRRADGKIQKPEGWQPPDIKSILDKAHTKYICKIASITL